MPDISGIETYQLLKAIDPRVTVVLSSGFGKDRRVEAGLKLGIDRFLPKPYALHALAEVFSELLAPAVD